MDGSRTFPEAVTIWVETCDLLVKQCTMVQYNIQVFLEYSQFTVTCVIMNSGEINISDLEKTWCNIGGDNTQPHDHTTCDFPRPLIVTDHSMMFIRLIGYYVMIPTRY